MKKLSLVVSTFYFVTATIALPRLISSTSPVLAQTAGCGSGWSNTALKVLSPVASNQFRVACNEHDACYDTYGKSKQECDKAFHNRMLGICSRDHNTILGRPLRIACNGRADAYYAAVRDYGSDAYNKAQAAVKPSFSWSQAGIIPGMNCTRIHEDADPHAWSDNYLCSSQNWGVRWSQANAISGMKCTRIHEDADPHAWGDNFLCVPQSSSINFRWSQAGAIAGLKCLRVHEDADPHAWSDNYLCW
ncbi:MAG: hypothetical protein RLZZ184_4126 [Cyanobacteriota bacterium]|jgi:hypothetical protein